MQAPEGKVLVAKVTVNDETLIVTAEEVQKALFALADSPVAGLCIQADVRIDSMSEVQFAALPEYQ
jgi:hypothetical protein